MNAGRDGRGRYAPVPVTVPLCVRRSRSARVAKGNHQRRINEMRRAREVMEAAPDYQRLRHGAPPVPAILPRDTPEE